MLTKVGILGLAWVVAALPAMPSPAQASELNGPGRFCGYSPIIDLWPGERVVTLAGGIHSGAFRWSGDFGTLEVLGIGWASKPTGKIAVRRNALGHVRFTPRPSDGEYRVAIWNRSHGAAYFSSSAPLTKAQLAAIDRVDLIDEGQQPEGCKLRTIVIWE